MKSYTIKFGEHNQDNLNIIPFKKGDTMPSFLDYKKVLKNSIAEGRIKNEDEIQTLLDGSDPFAEWVKIYANPIFFFVASEIVYSGKPNSLHILL